MFLHQQILFLEHGHPITVLILHGTFVHFDLGLHGLVGSLKSVDFLLVLLDDDLLALVLLSDAGILLAQAYDLNLEFLLLIGELSYFERQFLNLATFLVRDVSEQLLHFLTLLF